MPIKDQIQDDLKAAMKSGDTRRREILRLLMAAFKQVEVDRRVTLSDEDVTGLLITEAKKRRESIDEMTRAGRTELAAQEQYELEAIEGYLPRQLSREEIERIVSEAIAETGATDPKDMGRVMGAAMPRLRGQADGKLVNEIVRQKLGA
ncbi:MAG: GatB/YqeY domain-containing protein [Anaerolineae bacterium]|nr:GatB/YqeY domain-containing protein [Anaerolineae bacterium]